MPIKKTSDAPSLQALYELISNAEKSLSHAHKLLAAMLPRTQKDTDEIITKDYGHTYKHGSSQIIEGIFNGRDMVGSDNRVYPVPANYASKSKILEGSRLKATIKPDGSLQYKIIKEIPFTTTTGTLIRDNERFVVISQGTLYQVLPAAVTFVQARVGDRLAIRIPRDEVSSYAAIESLVPAEIGLSVA